MIESVEKESEENVLSEPNLMSNKVPYQPQLDQDPYQNFERNQSSTMSKDTPPVKFSDRVDMLESHPKHQ